MTPNTQTATLWACMNLKDEPIVVELPPCVLGRFDKTLKPGDFELVN